MLKTPVGDADADADAGGRRMHVSWKICDFGVSRLLSDDDSNNDADADTDADADGGGVYGTVTGGVGTSLYMAPEAILHDAATLKQHPFACDVYSYAILAWQVLTRDRPYVREQLHGPQPVAARDLKQRIAAGLRPYMASADEWPAGMAALVARCWAGEAGERPGFRAVLGELRGAEERFKQRQVQMQMQMQMQ